MLQPQPPPSKRRLEHPPWRPIPQGRSTLAHRGLEGGGLHQLHPSKIRWQKMTQRRLPCRSKAPVSAQLLYPLPCPATSLPPILPFSLW
jgi:hypothetical protein